jgi:hypothetical protein
MELPQNTSPNAILYTLRELGRRAGASPSSIARWRVSFSSDGVRLFPNPASQACIYFTCDLTKPSRFFALRNRPASRYEWMDSSNPALRTRVRDFVVLFEDRHASGAPLFRRIDSENIACEGDILTCSLWTLARFEEVQEPRVTDEHGRFPAAASAAFAAACLDRPIVDEYALALQDVLAQLMPGWKPQERRFSIKLSHDVDLAGVPFKIKTTLGHLYPRTIPKAFLQDVLAFAGLSRPAYLEAVLETARISQRRGFASAFYWQAAPPTQWDAGYAPEHPRIRRVIETLITSHCEIGIHPGYYTFGSQPKLEREIGRLRSIVGDAAMGGRQHYLRWSPETWKTWEACGLAYDSSVGFADAMGFRAGTCIPYHPWLFDEDREAALLEIPLIVMDCTPVRYMSLSIERALESIRELVERCKAVQGVFTLLWHNASVIERPYAALYPKILDLIGSAPSYEWRDDAATLSVPFVSTLATEATP